MFPYDAALVRIAAATPARVEDVLAMMQGIEDACVDGDGLKWFNWLYLRVTEAVSARVAGGEFEKPLWIAALDVQFAKFYFNALGNALQGRSSPGCWRALFDQRQQPDITRLQFALAGINAHINHDLPQAIAATCRAIGVEPAHDSVEYRDYTDLNSTLDAQIDAAKRMLNVRLLGDALPSVSQLENLVAAWGTAAAREKAWVNAGVLWHLQAAPSVADGFIDSLDGLTTFAGKALLVPVLG